MGGVVSTGQNNDDLIDNLLDADYIRTETIEHVFRAVDRGHYFLPDARGNAYKDLAWKCGHLHISAPCIYTEVLEGLSLQPGQSFLNLGSGTGYLSTLAGLILGSNGINHGIEVHEDVVQYAYKRLEEFKKLSGALDEFDFCEPKFVVGNCLCLATDLKYDRVYCGGGCPSQYEPFVKSLLKVGGILVMPANDQLVQVKRINQNNFDVNILLPVSFATLIIPDEKQELCDLLYCEPQSLQSLCRAKVRKILRKNIDQEFPEEIKRPRHVKKTKKKSRVLRRLTVPLFENDDTSDEEQFEVERGLLAGTRGVIAISHNVDRSDANSSNNDDTSEPDSPERLNPFVCLNMQDEFESIMNLYSAPVSEIINEAEEAARTEESIDRNSSSNEEISNVNCSEKAEVHPRDRHSSTSSTNLDENEGCVTNDSDKDEKAGGDVPSTSAESQPKPEPKPGNRIKFDSGLGDEIVEKDINMISESSDQENIEVDSNSSSAEDNEAKRNKRSKTTFKVQNSGLKWRRINLPEVSGSDTEPEVTEEAPACEHKIMVPSPYTPLMASKIQKLPLPHVLKKYLNYYKDF